MIGGDKGEVFIFDAVVLSATLPFYPLLTGELTRLILMKRD